jgi:hypothetical protein
MIIEFNSELSCFDVIPEFVARFTVQHATEIGFVYTVVCEVLVCM